MPPSLKLACEVSVGVGGLQIVDDLGASIGFGGEDCQLSQLGIADVVAFDHLVGVYPASTHNKHRVAASEAEARRFTVRISQGQPTQSRGFASNGSTPAESAAPRAE